MALTALLRDLLAARDLLTETREERQSEIVDAREVELLLLSEVDRLRPPASP